MSYQFSIGSKDTAFSQSVPFLFVLSAKFPVLWLAKRILLLTGDVESNSDPTSVCTVQCMWRGVLHWTVHSDDGSRQTLSKWFLCWTRGGTDCRHNLWVSWVSSLQTWEEGSKTTNKMSFQLVGIQVVISYS